MSENGAENGRGGYLGLDRRLDDCRYPKRNPISPGNGESREAVSQEFFSDLLVRIMYEVEGLLRKGAPFGPFELLSCYMDEMVYEPEISQSATYSELLLDFCHNLFDQVLAFGSIPQFDYPQNLDEVRNIFEYLKDHWIDLKTNILDLSTTRVGGANLAEQLERITKILNWMIWTRRLTLHVIEGRGALTSVTREGSPTTRYNFPNFSYRPSTGYQIPKPELDAFIYSDSRSIEYGPASLTLLTEKDDQNLSLLQGSDRDFNRVVGSIRGQTWDRIRRWPAVWKNRL